MDLLEDLEPSPTADSIYYSDLFIINSRVWLIMGCGKSTAARIASGKEEGADLGRDSFAIKSDGGRLFSKFDAGARWKNSGTNVRQFEWHRVDVVAFCFNKEETAKAYANRPIALLEVDSSLVGTLVSNYLYPAVMAPYVFDEEALEWLRNPPRRFQRFMDVTSGLNETTFVVVPFMSMVEEKAELYLAYKPGQAETCLG